MGCVLVIDDEGMIRELLKQALNRLNHRVDMAENAESGICKFDSGRYDLVITDVRMPGVDGRWVAGYIRQSKRSQTPVIGVSGTPWLLQGGLFDDVLQKPFALHALIEKADRLIRDTRVGRPAEAEEAVMAVGAGSGRTQLQSPATESEQFLTVVARA